MGASSRVGVCSFVCFYVHVYLFVQWVCLCVCNGYSVLSVRSIGSALPLPTSQH